MYNYSFIVIYKQNSLAYIIIIIILYYENNNQVLIIILLLYNNYMILNIIITYFLLTLFLNLKDKRVYFKIRHGLSNINISDDLLIIGYYHNNYHIYYGG